MITRRLVLGGLAAPLILRAAHAQAGVELRVLSSGTFTAAYERLAPEFERRTGHRLVIGYGASFGPDPTSLPERLGRGEGADVLLALRDGLEALGGAGHLDPSGIVNLAESRIAFAVRAGTPRPDMSTPDALRAALLAAPSIAYSPSGSGLFFERELVGRLGIAEQVLPKSRRVLRERIGAVVARGDAALGLQQVSELIPIAGIEIIRLPEALQNVSYAAAAVATRARQPEAARAFVAFLGSADAAPAVAATGLDPIRR
jgi:molybdate transport system substrate-binding protein